MNALLALGASMRLTRLVVADDLGEWWIKDPIREHIHADRAHRAKIYGNYEAPEEWWWKYADGLECPFCVGFWIGAGVLLTEELWGDTRWWKFGAAALTLNEVAAHLAVRLGDTAPEE